ncbi:MAG: J domain-containing protein [Alphaproteobacteria bacterium]
MTQAYPLHWPQGYARTKTPAGRPFRQSVNTAVDNLMAALRLFGKDTGLPVSDIVISSNVTLMKMEPEDPGIAVYFRWDNMDCCLAVDRYATPAMNLQAIVHVVEAERTKLRHGGLNIVRATFRGFAALPPPKGPDGQIAPPWWHTLGFGAEGEATLPVAEQRYRDLVKTKHPDRGGSAAEFNVITDAMRQAREILKG